jgi:hypothetical protein
MNGRDLFALGAVAAGGYFLLKGTKVAENLPFFGGGSPGLQSYGEDFSGSGQSAPMGASAPAASDPFAGVTFAPQIANPFGEPTQVSAQDTSTPSSKKSSGSSGKASGVINTVATGGTLSSKTLPVVNGKLADPITTALVNAGVVKPSSHVGTSGSTPVYVQLGADIIAAEKAKTSTKKKEPVIAQVNASSALASKISSTKKKV